MLPLNCKQPVCPSFLLPQEVLRGYVGDRSSRPVFGGPSNLFDVLGSGYQRPFELATLRLYNMNTVLTHCERALEDRAVCSLCVVGSAAATSCLGCMRCLLGATAACAATPFAQQLAMCPAALVAGWRACAVTQSTPYTLSPPYVPCCHRERAGPCERAAADPAGRLHRL